MESNRIDTIERLGRLLDEGKISADEFETLKGDVMTDPGHGLTTPGQRAGVPTPKSFPDKYQEWLDDERQPTSPGWYPDPGSDGTLTRFYDGHAWVDRTRQRKRPGWYPHPERSDLERFFDGLEYNHEVRPVQASSHQTTAIEPQSSKVENQDKDWRFWLGLGLVALGILAALKDSMGFSNEPIQDVRMFVAWFGMDPLIWGGAAGAFLLYRWRHSQATNKTKTIAAPATRPRNPFWIEPD